MNLENEEYCIAIIGMEAKYPEAENVDIFWENLKSGKDCITHDPKKSKEGYVGAYGKVGNIDLFDAEFFGFTRTEAVDSDPQQRIAFELIHHAMERAGYPSFRHDGKVGFYMSFENGTYVWNYIMQRGGNWYDNYELFKFHIGTRGTKIAYKFDFRGPALLSEYACASSLATVHQACQSLLNYECDIALAGGIDLGPEQDGYPCFDATTSPTGIIRPFDADADGLVPGCGAGVVVLKRLPEAIEDHDNIIAVIRGTFVNNDGNRKAGFAAPGVFGQQECLESALTIAETTADELDYVETHGTATVLGDSVELRALKNVIGKREAGNEVMIGSVKSNIGHTNIAAGIANLIKGALMLQHRILVPSIHYRKPNTELLFDNDALKVCTELRPFTKNKEMVLSCSSVGMGGANAMAILSEYPNSDAKEETSDTEQLILFSGYREKDVKEIGGQLNHFGRNDFKDWKNAAWTLQVGRDYFPYRSFAVSGSQFSKYVENPRIVHADTETPGKVVFVFSGSGSQSTIIGSELYKSDKVFAAYLDACFNCCVEKGLKTIYDDFFHFGQRTKEKKLDNGTGMLIIFSVGYALAMRLIDLGIEPQCMIGHSLGEYIAATVGGIFMYEDAIDLLIKRAALIESLEPGGMLNVACSRKKLEECLIEGVEIGAYNASNRFMVAGSKEAVDAFEKMLPQQRIAANRMEINRAGHCYMMDPISSAYTALVEKVTLSTSKYPILSCCDLSSDDNSEVMETPEYWGMQMRQPVAFHQRTNQLADEKVVFVEIGASNQLTSMIRKIKVNKKPVKAFSCFGVGDVNNSRQGFLELLGFLWCHGLQIDFQTLYERKPYRIPFIKYPFQRESFWRYRPYEMGKNFENLENNTSGVKTDAEGTVKDSLDDSGRNSTDTILLEIIREVLGYPDITIDDYLYDYGMDSLMALLVSSKVKEKLGKEIKLAEVYGIGSIRELSDFLETRQEGMKETVNDEPVKAEKSMDDLFKDFD